MKNLIRSKTVAGLSLGILGVILDASNFLSLPQLAVQIVQVVGFLVTTMGIRDSMLEQKANLIAKIIDFKSKTFWGVLIEAVVHLTQNPEQFIGLPDEARFVLQILGAIAIALGLRDAAQRSKK